MAKRKSPGGGIAEEVQPVFENTLKIRPMDPAWSLRSQMDKNPMANGSRGISAVLFFS